MGKTVSSSSLDKMNKRINTLRDEICCLEQKKEELMALESCYYTDYFAAYREEYAHLTNIPTFGTQNHVLRDYSCLNIEEVGKMICELIKKYEKKKYVTEVNHACDYDFNGFSEIKRLYSLLLIKDSHVKYGDSSCSFDGAMFMFYGDYNQNNKYSYLINRFGEIEIYDGLSVGKESCNHPTFMDLSKYEYIQELIYSLAYYQRQHGITHMSASKTRDVYKRIYKL